MGQTLYRKDDILFAHCCCKTKTKEIYTNLLSFMKFDLYVAADKTKSLQLSESVMRVVKL